MKNSNWVIIIIVLTFIGCATPRMKTCEDPVNTTPTEMKAAKGKELDAAIAPTNYANSDVGPSVMRSNRTNEFYLIEHPWTHYQPRPHGAPINYGIKLEAPKEPAFGVGLRNQNTTGNYCRWIVAPKFAIVPGLKLLKNPSFKTDQAQLRSFGLSVQVALQYRY